jgi:hypothetical protein
MLYLYVVELYNNSDWLLDEDEGSESWEFQYYFFLTPETVKYYKGYSLDDRLLSIVRNRISKDFRRDGNDLIEDPSYVRKIGYERLPIDIEKDSLFGIYMVYPWEILYNNLLEPLDPPIFEEVYIGEVPVDEIMNFKRKNIGIDIDIELLRGVQLTLNTDYSDPSFYSYHLNNILSSVKEEYEDLKEYFQEKRLSFLKLEMIKSFPMVKNYKIRKTNKGYHLRLRLRKPVSFDYRIKLREELGDDAGRILADKTFMDMSNKFEFITDILFEKKWVTGFWEHYSSREFQ